MVTSYFYICFVNSCCFLSIIVCIYIVFVVVAIAAIEKFGLFLIVVNVVSVSIVSVIEPVHGAYGFVRRVEGKLIGRQSSLELHLTNQFWDRIGEL